MGKRAGDVWREMCGGRSVAGDVWREWGTGECSVPGGRMFFQVLFEKTRSMKFAKRPRDRWILASSGTVPFWQPESP